MIRKFTLFLFCLFFYFSHIDGQVPGYLGKRFFVKTDLSLSPALWNPTASNHGYSGLYGTAPSSLGVNKRLGLEGGYVLSRTRAITLGCDYLKTGMILKDVVSPTLSLSAKPNNYDRHYLFYNLQGITADVGYQKYKPQKGAIAPLGNYVSYHFSASILNGSVLDKKTDYYDSFQNVNAPLGFTPRSINYYFGVEWGKNNILFDRLLLNYALRINIPVGSSFKTIKDDIKYIDSYSSYKAYNQALFDYNVGVRMLGYSFVAIRLGIGILP